ncbi:MmgE/PrpD family protein [Rhizobium laguerreae]|uniref:MmgE/PrpD family protein n=1 Tax=Rhizobium laguerreae TaxID=1076926 RepID=UPI001C914EC3|nr:MmgE/PrpD family protein [Rhizobium laguerreae]MBY3101259.1 MmgE/PrpD family protein [Rhizobium laguerreae]
MYTCEKIGRLVSDIVDVPPSAMEATRRCILDAVSAAVPGQATEGGKAARNGAIAVWGKGPIPIWLSSARSTTLGTVFANSAAVSMLDLDDGHRAAAGHPGASIVPSVVAAVHEEPSLASRATTAIAIGYQVGVSIAASRDLRTLDTVDTGRWCGQAAAAAVGWLKGASPRAIAEAIAASGTIAPMIATAGFTQVGNHVKEAIPHATANGLVCLHLAQAGFIAPLDILDDESYFNSRRLVDMFQKAWLIESTYFKPYSCCRFIHASIDGLLKITADRNLSIQDITKIRVETFGRALSLPNQKAPNSLQHAQYSIPFCLGVTAARGRDALVPMTDPSLLTDPAVLSVSSLVDLVFDADLDSQFSAAVPSRITVSCGDKSFSETVMTPLGEPSNPMGWDALFEKFHVLASPHLVSRQEADLRRALDDMRAGDLTPLLIELSRPAAMPEKSSSPQTVMRI